MRVVQCREQSRLALEARPPLLVGGQELRQDLEGDVPSQTRVAGTIHLPHASGAEQA
jgi:hypothetical protein